MKPVAAATVLLGLGVALSQAQPANDMFTSRIVISGTNNVVTGSSVGATWESGEPYHAGNLGGASVWWSWTAPSHGVVTINTAGSTFDTVLGVYTGSSVFALSAVASNDDDPDSSVLTSKVGFEVLPGQTYQIAVDGYGGATGSVRLQVQFGPPQPDPPAPAWVLPDPYGVMVNSSNYAGKVIIFDFWATWCGPCKVEIPDYVFLQDKYGPDGLVILGPSVDSTSQAVITFMATNSTPLNYQVIMADYALQQAYGGISAIPTTFIIDRQNIIREKYVGTRSRTTFEQAIIPLLYGNTRLACVRNGGQMAITWPTTVAPLLLESANDLTNPYWSTWPMAPTVIDGTNTVLVPMNESSRCFRLRIP